MFQLIVLQISHLNEFDVIIYQSIDHQSMLQMSSSQNGPENFLQVLSETK